MQSDSKESDGFHIVNIGSLIEKNENRLRKDLENIYLNKTKQVRI